MYQSNFNSWLRSGVDRPAQKKHQAIKDRVLHAEKHKVMTIQQLNKHCENTALALVYNKRQWNWAGQEFPRGGDAISQHITHIHIEWAMSFAASAAWEEDLIKELGNRNWG
jgi:hypothetical protein